MDICDIETQHLSAILALNEISVAVLSPLDGPKLTRLVAEAVLAKVIIIDEQVAAFLLAFTANTEYESINYQWFNKKYAQFLYIDRIVVADDFRGQKLASHLYNYLLKWTVDNAIPRLVAEIAIQPPNEASLKFHQKFGFFELEQLVHSEEKIVSLQGKER